MMTETLLTPTNMWSMKIYSSGWKKPDLGTTDVTEKATGAKLEETGIASAEDVSAAAAAAREAQKEWAKLPGPKRGGRLPISSSKRRAQFGRRRSGRSR